MRGFTDYQALVSFLKSELDEQPAAASAPTAAAAEQEAAEE